MAGLARLEVLLGHLVRLHAEHECQKQKKPPMRRSDGCDGSSSFAHRSRTFGRLLRRRCRNGASKSAGRGFDQQVFAATG
ncbi:hypothetical protein CSE45_0587 [Citreicella sp. SE45]|nr:hypothetical protein CSE45_0587 [Citreicella sp. SE45]